MTDYKIPTLQYKLKESTIQVILNLDCEVMTITTATIFLQRLLQVALQKEATDIHFYPSPTKVQLFFRISGKRVFHQELSFERYSSIINYLKFTAGMDIGEVRKPQDGAISVYVQSNKLNLRLSTLPSKQLESLAIRILPKGKSLQLNDLLLFQDQVKELKECLTKRTGVILLTGPTGSGKTTLLYALVEELLANHSYQVITLEDPIEKELLNVHQVQVNERSGITYQAGLKSALRHDPDVLMVGEIRDRETAKFVFHAAYTGHLVLTTLHAKNALGTIHRLIEMGIKPVDIEQNLLTIASLELIPISTEHIPQGRRAILEILNQKSLTTYLHTFDKEKISFPSFNYLKRKAIKYGYSAVDLYGSQEK